MKTTLIMLILLSESMYGQNSRQTQFDLRGSWTVQKYTASRVSAMTDAQAAAWKGKKATAKKVIHFPFNELPFYRDVFTQNDCPFIENRHLYPDTIVTTGKYFEQFRISYTILGLDAERLRIVRTPCKDTPFHEIIIKNNNEILIFWDGVFFTLTRDKS